MKIALTKTQLVFGSAGLVVAAGMIISFFILKQHLHVASPEVTADTSMTQDSSQTPDTAGAAPTVGTTPSKPGTTPSASKTTNVSTGNSVGSSASPPSGNSTPSGSGSSGGSSGGGSSSGGGGTSNPSCAYPSFPNGACTGVPSGTVLSAYTGSSSPAAGAVIDGKTITQCLDITQPGVIIKNSRITAQCSWVVDSWITSSNQANWTQVLDSEIICVNGGNGIGERGVIVRRVEISGCENGLDLDQDGIIEDSYIHSLDEGPGGAGHGDGIQSPLFINVTIRHNTIIGRTGNLTSPGANATSAIITPPNGTSNSLIERNFLAGGAYTLYCPENSPNNVRVLNNTFARMGSSLGPAYGYTDGCNSGTIFSGNVTDSGQAINP